MNCIPFAPCTAIPLAISTASGVAVSQDRDRVVLSLQAEAYAAQPGEIHVAAAGSHERPCAS